MHCHPHPPCAGLTHRCCSSHHRNTVAATTPPAVIVTATHIHCLPAHNHPSNPPSLLLSPITTLAWPRHVLLSILLSISSTHTSFSTIHLLHLSHPISLPSHPIVSLSSTAILSQYPHHRTIAS